MKRSTAFLLFSCAFLSVIFFPETARAIEIPIERSAINLQDSGPAQAPASEKFAYVDIELVFNQHPMTARLRQEFEAEVERLKKDYALYESSMTALQAVIKSSATEITRLTGEIEQVKKAIDEQNAQPQQVQLPGTTNYVILPPSPQTSKARPDPGLITAYEAKIAELKEKIGAMNREFESVKTDFERRSGSDRRDLESLEQSNTRKVLDDIYKILEKLALEENFTIILDKNNVLYGRTTLDATDKVLDRTRGR